MATSEAVLHLEIPPHPHLSRLVRERIGAFAAEQGVGGDELSDFLTALGEAIANAIEHARSDAPIRHLRGQQRPWAGHGREGGALSAPAGDRVAAPRQAPDRRLSTSGAVARDSRHRSAWPGTA